MSVTNSQYGTRVDEVADGIFRISTPVSDVPGGFSFNQYLVRDREPLLFHTGPRRMVALVAEAIGSVVPVATLRHIGFSHYENDECGGLNALLAMAPDAQPLCGKVNAMINGDAFDRPPRALGDGEELAIGTHRVRWLDAPHLPHAWECGYLMEVETRTLLCGDLFTQPGTGETAVTSGDILGPSEARLMAQKPTTLACMHGSAWRGDGAALLGALGDALDGRERR
jgi:flavorubredoxin